MDDNPTVVAEAKRKEESATLAEVHRQETEVSQEHVSCIRSQCNKGNSNGTKSSQEKERSLREIQAKIAYVRSRESREHSSPCKRPSVSCRKQQMWNKYQVVLDMQAKLVNVEAERIKAVQMPQNERQLRENGTRPRGYQAGAWRQHGRRQQLWPRRKMYGRSASAEETKRLETESATLNSTMQKRKFKWHKVCTMKRTGSAREMQAKLDNVEAERMRS